MGPVGAGDKTVEGHDHLENYFSIAHVGRDLPLAKIHRPATSSALLLSREGDTGTPASNRHQTRSSAQIERHQRTSTPIRLASPRESTVDTPLARARNGASWQAGAAPLRNGMRMPSAREILRGRCRRRTWRSCGGPTPPMRREAWTPPFHSSRPTRSCTRFRSGPMTPSTTATMGFEGSTANGGTTLTTSPSTPRSCTTPGTPSYPCMS